MENQFYKTVPVSEGLPTEDGLYFVLMQHGTEQVSVFQAQDNDLVANWKKYYRGWLRPVPLTLPEEVSNDKISDHALKEAKANTSPEFTTSHYTGIVAGMLTMRSILSPAFASLQEENRNLKQQWDKGQQDALDLLEKAEQLQEENERLRAAVREVLSKTECCKEDPIINDIRKLLTSK